MFLIRNELEKQMKNRDIEFRFWDKDLNKMCYRKPAHNDFSHPNIVPMQYVGLKDKFGNEIYEGDVVRWDDGSDGEKWRVGVVEINPDLQFRIIKIDCDFKQSAKEGYVFKFGRFICTDTENHLEIIGNVHQKAWEEKK